MTLNFCIYDLYLEHKDGKNKNTIISTYSPKVAVLFLPFERALHFPLYICKFQPCIFNTRAVTTKQFNQYWVRFSTISGPLPTCYFFKWVPSGTKQASNPLIFFRGGKKMSQVPYLIFGRNSCFPFMGATRGRSID